MKLLAREINALRSVEGGHDFAFHVTNSSKRKASSVVVIPVHKLIISARCSVFAAMLRSNTIESTQNYIKIEDSNPKAMETLVSYLYCDEAQLESVQHGLDVCHAASKYGLKKLATLCEGYFQTILATGSLTKEAFSAVFGAAEDLDLINVEKACLGYINSKKRKLVDEWDFPNFLSHEQCKKVIMSDTGMSQGKVYSGKVKYRPSDSELSYSSSDSERYIRPKS